MTPRSGPGAHTASPCGREVPGRCGGEPPDAGGAVSAGIPVEGMGAGGGGAAAPGSAVRGGVLVCARLGGAAAPQLRPGAFLFDGGGACDLLSTLLHRALCGGDSGLFSRNPGPERKYPGGIAVFLHFLPCQPCRRGVIIKGVPGETPS